MSASSCRASARALAARGVRNRSGPSQRVWPGARVDRVAVARSWIDAPRQREAVSSSWAEAMARRRPEKALRKPSSDTARRADWEAIDCTAASTFFTRWSISASSVSRSSAATVSWARAASSARSC